MTVTVMGLVTFNSCFFGPFKKRFLAGATSSGSVLEPAAMAPNSLQQRAGSGERGVERPFHCLTESGMRPLSMVSGALAPCHCPTPPYGPSRYCQR
jgi:hypothetical protein